MIISPVVKTTLSCASAVGRSELAGAARREFGWPTAGAGIAQRGAR